MCPHVVQVDEGLGVHGRESLGGRHAYCQATRHARTARHSDAIQVVDRELRLVEGLCNRPRHMPVMSSRSMQRVNTLRVLVVLAHHDGRENGSIRADDRRTRIVARALDPQDRAS